MGTEKNKPASSCVYPPEEKKKRKKSNNRADASNIIHRNPHRQTNKKNIPSIKKKDGMLVRDAGSVGAPAFT